MRNLVNVFERVFNENDDFARQVTNYNKILNTEEWKFFTEAIKLIKQQMSYDMFSRAYTEMDETDKDVLQKTYYQTMLILDFLGNPNRWIKRRTVRKQKLTDLAERTSKQMGGQSW